MPFVIFVVFANVFFSFLLYVESFVKNDFHMHYPIQIYKRTKLNWFGVIIIFVWIFIFGSFYHVPVLIYNFIYWICHVGRRQ